MSQFSGSPQASVDYNSTIIGALESRRSGFWRFKATHDQQAPHPRRAAQSEPRAAVSGSEWGETACRSQRPPYPLPEPRYGRIVQSADLVTTTF